MGLAKRNDEETSVYAVVSTCIDEVGLEKETSLNECKRRLQGDPVLWDALAMRGLEDVWRSVLSHRRRAEWVRVEGRKADDISGLIAMGHTNLRSLYDMPLVGEVTVGDATNEDIHHGYRIYAQGEAGNRRMKRFCSMLLKAKGKTAGRVREVVALGKIEELMRNAGVEEGANGLSR